MGIITANRHFSLLFLIAIFFSQSLEVINASKLPFTRTNSKGSSTVAAQRKKLAEKHSSSAREKWDSNLPIRGGSDGNVSEVGPIQMFVETLKESRKYLVAAAVARSVSIFGMYPVDTIKTRMQMGQPMGLRDGIYKGVGGSLFGQVPYGVLTFGSYEIYKKKLLEKFPETSPSVLYAFAAVLGDITGSGWLCPSEVVKQQLQGGMYTSTREAVSAIWSTKGIGGFYQGYIGGLARDVPFRVCQLTSFEVTKNSYLRLKRKRSGMSEDAELTLSAAESAAVGAVCGTFSAAVTTPLDRIKTLLMTDSANYGGTVISCATKIIKDEGISGMFKGIVPRVAYIAPSVVIFFTAYEQVQNRFASSAQ
mmetsp:Transcript_8906/g.10308  ORF Transcript_8906/g.10308 Transcript_8906/m.10308 type:complete len:364 (+) Transcript_8906:72-1163(+)|eukprot:CAMPEP_0194365150 /NCGR_PEP_ID=MMETSP0174-20130528/13148_1 /TAXON_ID=216777 /ORGANISM="Proboscia alata, Strain PI-D3" /LENGTH=363 /DNA_ID=CAMNT_0039139643 /DNA_START=51 /DNA_END=1142 /DNA_ORIENTATION=-